MIFFNTGFDFIKEFVLEDNDIIRFASRMDQLPPYLFGMINKMKMEKRRNGDDVIGVVTNIEFFKEVVKLAKRFKFMVINDFAYSKITFYGYVAPSFLEADDAKVEMMNLANVAVAPRTGFSEEGEGYLRLALVENEERLRQAVRQMKKAMENMVV